MLHATIEQGKKKKIRKTSFAGKKYYHDGQQVQAG
jgi:hypothetical protein